MASALKKDLTATAKETTIEPAKTEWARIKEAKTKEVTAEFSADLAGLAKKANLLQIKDRIIAAKEMATHLAFQIATRTAEILRAQEEDLINRDQDLAAVETQTDRAISNQQNDRN